MEEDIIIGLYYNGILYDTDGNILFGFESYDNVKGKYFPEEKYLFINLQLHDNLEELITISHELRHAYQFHEINSDKPLEMESVILAWKNNFKNYINYSESTQYYNQSVEIDAHAFSYVISMYVFNLPLQFNRLIAKSSVIKRIEAIIKEYSLEDVTDCCRYTEFDPEYFKGIIKSC